MQLRLFADDLASFFRRFEGIMMVILVFQQSRRFLGPGLGYSQRIILTQSGSLTDTQERE